MERILLVVATIVVFCSGTLAQQDNTLTNFIYNKNGINPGSVGIGPDICASLIYRNQWDKFNGAPNSVLFTADANLSRAVRGGAGLVVDHDAIGFNRQSSVLLNYAYPLFFPNVGNGAGATLGVGAGIGFMSFGLKPEWVPPSSASDKLIPQATNSAGLDANFGAFFRRNDGRYYIGLSAKHLTGAKLQGIAYTLTRNYYLMAGYAFPTGLIGPGSLDFQTLVRSDFSRTTADLNVRYLISDFYAGVTYRKSDAIGILVGYDTRGVVIGYSFDYNVGSDGIASYSKGTHEIVLKRCIPIAPIPVQKSKHVKWL